MDVTNRVDIVEVGPRDGLQNDAADLTVEQKVEFIHRLDAAGVRRMETGSFVSPRAVPKMADSAEVFRRANKEKPSSRIALALNEKGMRRAIDAGADEVSFVLVAGEGFGQRNQRMSPQETADMLVQCAPLAHDANIPPVSYTHLRAHETSLHLVCRLLLEKGADLNLSLIHI